jgi:hypothetical protein
MFSQKEAICKLCGQKKKRQVKGCCFNCYRKHVWKRKLRICKHCKRERPHQAKEMCHSCFSKVYHYDHIKNSNYRRYHNISVELYKRITKRCGVCGFDKVVDLHHLDHDKKNNSETNLVGLCPNHHKMLHNYRFSKEVAEILKNKGYNPKITLL